MAEPRVAYRSWDITLLDGYLLPVSGIGGADYTWKPGENEAKCGKAAVQYRDQETGEIVVRKHDDHASIRRCSCGFYAIRDPFNLLLEDPGQLNGHYRRVYGEVELSGHVQLHSNGYRAQFATVRRLYWPLKRLRRFDGVLAATLARTAISAAVVRAAARYGVPVTKFPLARRLRRCTDFFEYRVDVPDLIDEWRWSGQAH